MKLLLFLFLITLFQGCLYFNDRGVSAHLYDNCHSYYDGDGNFVKECDGNIIDYSEMQDGVVAIKDEIKSNIHELTSRYKSKTEELTVDELTSTEVQKLKETNPTIREDIESNRCPCQ